MRPLLAAAPSLSRRPESGGGTRSDVVLRPSAVAMAFVGEGHPHETIAVPGVALAPDDVLVAIELSTICGSDVHTVLGRRSAPVPLVLGHESVGRVIALGEAGADAEDGTPLRIGDRVVWSVTVSCGECDRCTAGVTQKCRRLGKYGHERVAPHRELTGGFASHAQLRHGTAIVRVPEALPAAALAPASCATATACAAVRRGARGRDLDGVRVRVYGAGLVGLSAVAMAAAEGAIVDVVDPNADRLRLATRFGAEPDALSSEPEIAIEASGHAVSAAIADVAVGGTVVLVGSVFPAEPVPLDAESIVRRMVTIAGVHNYTGHELADAVSFLAGRGRAFPFAEMVGTVHPLADLDQAIALAAAPGAPPRIGVAAR
ncbi:alcohol dehydrogenase catalytic domain-containing protein [Microbacterium esteraromaticum]|uniref:alcohol dehydrogenase catalytic domain-containing protein n=1 Tax=Microbacterium esteraromaticum TaxID=57043 RepID=UPI00195A3924|nr:alcohol dehydrogenase catalytic domain-containing protein [Microbacterium esteraromaticum]MBM7465495.1 putative phosphonate catabolism associated alcohol dehydrogenase [Microbacterium esteraromaticum]